MSFRSSELAIQPKTKSRLRMVLKIYPEIAAHREQDKFAGEVVHYYSPDEFADVILNEVIKERYPLVIEMERKIAAVEKEMIEKCRESSSVTSTES